MQHTINVESGDGPATRWIVECYARDHPGQNIPIDWDSTGLSGRIEFEDDEFHQMTVTVRSGQNVSVRLAPARPIIIPPEEDWPISVAAGAGLGNQADKTVHFFTGESE